MSEYIPVNQPLLDGNEKKYLNECIDTGWISSEGPFVKRFEEEFAARVGRKHGIAVCNGTAALDAAVEALGIGEGDEVMELAIEAATEADARAKLAAYEALAKQVTAEAQVSSELTQGANGVILKARLQFTCTAEKLIFELRARSI